MLQLEKAAGVTLKYIPTKGGVVALQRVMSGDVTAGFNNLSDSYRSRDKLKILAIADLERDKDFLPDVPTFKEVGVAVDNSSVNFRGIMAPKGTPPEVVKLLAERVAVMFEDKKVKKKMKEGGSPMRVMALGLGPMKVMPSSAQAWAKSAFSDKKP